MLQYCFFLLFLCSTLLQAQSSLIPYRKGDKWGFADSSGKIVIPCTYEDAKQFGRAKLAPVKQQGMYGYINKQGIVVIPFQFDKADEFNFNVAEVQVNSEHFIINVKGESIYNSDANDFADISTPYNEVGKVIKYNNKQGFIFSKSGVSIPTMYDSISVRVGNDDLSYMKLLWVKNNGKVGMIACDNSAVVPIQYDEVKVGSESTLADELVFTTRLDDLFGFYKRTGLQICPPKYKSVGRFSWGLCRVTTVNGKEGYIDERGKEYWED